MIVLNMLNLRRFAPTAVLLFALAAAAVADTMPRDLAAAYKSLDKAMRQLNFKAFSSMFAADFVVVDPEGKTMNRKAFLAMVQPLFASSRSATSKIEVKRVVVAGDYAEIAFDMHLHMKGKSGAIKIHEIGSDFWQKRNGKWLLYRTVEEKLDITGPAG